MKGSPKQIRWALGIQKNRLAVWSRSELYNEIESIITAIDDSGWWIANRDQPLEPIYSKMKADAVALVDLQSWPRIDTPTGSRWISPTLNVVTGEIVVDGTVPF